MKKDKIIELILDSALCGVVGNNVVNNEKIELKENCIINNDENSEEWVGRIKMLKNKKKEKEKNDRKF